MTAVEHVSDTAFWIANYRANETDRPNALFRDPLARKLAGVRGREIANSMPGSKMTEWITAIRTVVIDKYINQAVANGVDTVLNLGAGLDTRPYRMELPQSLRWVEVDFPRMIEYKERLLAADTPRCNLERFKLDLTNRDLRRALLANVNASAKRVLVLTEGVVPYITNDDAASLADDLQLNDKFELWIVDYFSHAVLSMSQRQNMRERMQNSPFLFDPPDWNAFFREHGWRARQMRYLAEESVALKRPIPLPRIAKIFYVIGRLFMSKAKQMQSMKFMGYAVMERV